MLNGATMDLDKAATMMTPVTVDKMIEIWIDPIMAVDEMILKNKMSGTVIGKMAQEEIVIKNPNMTETVVINRNATEIAQAAEAVTKKIGKNDDDTSTRSIIEDDMESTDTTKRSPEAAATAVIKSQSIF
jgi:hypothetical protein